MSYIYSNGKSNISWYLAPDQEPTPKTDHCKITNYDPEIIIFILGDEIVCINTQIVHGKTVDEGNLKYWFNVKSFLNDP